QAAEELPRARSVRRGRIEVRRERRQRLMIDDGLAALLQLPNAPDHEPLVSSAGLRRFEVARLDIDEYRGIHLRHVQVREGTHVVAPEGVPDQDVWAGDAARVQRGVQLSGNLRRRA